jgi:environmental stress-induced protein Ves
MELVVADRPPRRLDRLFDPFVFSGDSAAECRLIDGPIRDFNLMVERSALRSRLEVLHLDATPRLLDPASGDRLIHCFDGVIEFVMGAGAPMATLQPNGTAILGRASGAQEEMRMAAATGRQATVAIIDLTPA